MAIVADPESGWGKLMPSVVARPETNRRLVLVAANPPEDMRETKALAITEEPAGGSATPTTAPGWVGGIP